MWTPAQPKRIIPYSAIVVAILFTADFVHDIYVNYTTRSHVEQRVAELTLIQESATKAVKTTPPTTVIERKKTIREPIILYKEAEPTGSGSSTPKPTPIVKPREHTVTITETKPNPVHEAAQQQLKDTTIELEAEGIKLKMVNEATWNGIFKLCFLWAFVLSTLLGYKYFTSRLIKT